MQNSLERTLLAVAALLSFSASAFGGTAITTSTTLAKETGNNTSAADTWAGATNGTLPATNISKMDVHRMLYSGATTKMYVHFMGWFGGTNHMNVGYHSDDATQVKRQVTDMMSRGIQGAILDWYGPNNTRPNNTAYLLKTESESRGGSFEFGITEDQGALKTCANTVGCDVTQNMINDLNYAYTNFEQSPAYMRSGGRPVVFFFGVEAFAIDWTRVIANVSGNPLFVQRNSGAFTKSQFNGAYAWVAPETVTTTDTMALGYIDSFYSTGNTNSTKMAYGSAYKGFDGSLSSWSTSKYIGQYCGQTWIKSFAQAGKYHSTSNQLLYLQIPTWNDYEEGTSLENGIDNCVTTSASMSGNVLNWSITGDPATVDHFTLFISPDGVNLMPLGNVPVTQSSLDLAPFGFAPGSYSLFVKAVGIPSVANKMSAGVPFTVANQPPTISLAVTPTSGVGTLNVSATATAADADGTLSSTNINFGDGVIAQGLSATHIYSTPGTYTITATTTDNLGATAVATQSVVLKANTPPAVTLSVTPNSGINSVNATATMTASDSDGGVTSTHIDFGDGASSSALSATHLYGTPGTYTVTATATDNLGASSSQTATVTVAANQPPLAVLSVTPGTAVVPFTVTASTAASSDVDGSVASSSIDYGDGTALAGTSTSHTYTVPGTYMVRATVTDNLGASSTATATVVATAPAPKVTISTPASGSTVTSPVRIAASGTSSYAVTAMQIYVDNVLTYQASASTVDVSLSMLSGARNVVVQGWDSSGATFKTGISLNVLANQSPVAKLSVTPTSGTGPLTVQASAAASYDPDGTISKTSIDFGDGTVATAASASHIYNAAGTYTVTATVWDNVGASSSTTATVTVAAPPVPASYVNVTSPTNNGKSSNPVHVTATAFSAAGVTAMKVYVDGVSKYSVNAANVDTYIKMNPGSHKITVQAWDTTGAVVKAPTITITVYSSGTSLVLAP